VQKKPGRGGTTDASYYIFDPDAKKWLRSATINSPNGGKPSVATIGGSIASFLENFLGKDKAVPRLALYRLWLGSNIDSMKCLTTATGDGTWGELNDCYFLAAGDRGKLDAVFLQLEPKYGKPQIGEKSETLPLISDKPMPPDVIGALKNLLQSAKP
jgi:hypothetical protein